MAGDSMGKGPRGVDGYKIPVPGEHFEISARVGRLAIRCDGGSGGSSSRRQ